MILANRAQAQAAIGGEKAGKAFDDYIQHVSRVQREDADQRMKERLDVIRSIKEIRFRPLTSVQRSFNLPTVDAKKLRDSGRLRDQMRAVPARRPTRARNKRGSR